MTEKYINIDLEDPRSAKIAEVLSNKTCKKILSLLAEKEMNASEIAQAINLPLNTIGYNLEKLVSAGLIEKSKRFFWSIKGKKIDSYTIVNKKIIISPRSMIKGIVPTIIISGLIALAIKFFVGVQRVQFASSQIVEKVKEGAAPLLAAGAEKAASGAARSAVQCAVQSIANEASYSWLWFLLGALAGLLVFLIWNWKKL